MSNIIMCDPKGGIIVPNLRQYKEVVATEDHNNNNRLVIQMEPYDTYSHPVVLVYTKNYPQPHPEGSTYLIGMSNSYISSVNANGILRSNGTIGSDGNMSEFNPSTGTVSIGGPYGVVRAGMTICVIILEVPA